MKKPRRPQRSITARLLLSPPDEPPRPKRAFLNGLLALDVDDDGSVAEVFGTVGGSLDVLVNNAGIYSINAVEDESLEQYQRVMQTNYFGAVRC
ncbi:MAG: SDR family NAD(P)-dependent oxidoreductase, partial [Candidatus Eiseniibacteriota bacterium]